MVSGFKIYRRVFTVSDGEPFHGSTDECWLFQAVNGFKGSQFQTVSGFKGSTDQALTAASGVLSVALPVSGGERLQGSTDEC